MAAEPVQLTLAHSADADDVAMWWPATGKIAPDGTPRTGPAIDTGRLRLRALPEDIDVLNRRAIEGGDMDVTAVSFFTAARVADRYAVLACGSSMGEGYGPKVVAREGAGVAAVEDLLRAGPGVRIAVPGVRTTASLVLTLMLGRGRFEAVEMPFERVMGAVREGGVDAGVVIHEGQVTFADEGLREVEDLGRWWGEWTGGLPLPLGANAARLDLDDRHGAGTLAEVARVLRRSIEHAMQRREETVGYAMEFARAQGRPITRPRLERYLSMYVTKYSVDLGERGRAAVSRLYEEAARAGLLSGRAGPSVIG